MSAVPRRSARTAVLETAPIRADFQTSLQALREAAQAWGVRPDHPEGQFVSTMIGTQAGFAELALSLAEALHEVVHCAQGAAEDELAKQRVVTERTQLILTKASGVIENVEKGARLAIEKIEIEKAEVLTQLVRDIIPDMTRGVREALVIKERRYNHERDWRRALSIGGLMLGLMMVGYVWGIWSDWGLTSRLESIGIAIEKCRLTSHWADDKGNRLCEMNDFSRIDLGSRQIVR
jgi:hypothetical protein